MEAYKPPTTKELKLPEITFKQKKLAKKKIKKIGRSASKTTGKLQHIAKRFGRPKHILAP